MIWELTTNTREETFALGRALGELVQAGDVLCLQGELGAGKTTFVQGLGVGLGVRAAIHSPTFILANEHRGGRIPLYHLDVYRVSSAAEALGFGLDDYFDNAGVVVIEWAEKIRAALPDENLWIEFRHAAENARRLRFTAHGARFVELLRGLMASSALVNAPHVVSD